MKHIILASVMALSVSAFAQEGAAPAPEKKVEIKKEKVVKAGKHHKVEKTEVKKVEGAE